MGDRFRILVADDDSTERNMLVRILRTWGYEPVPAHGGNEAWDLLEKQDLRLALLDWTMPGTDGPTLCRRVRELDRQPYTYLILLTAKGREHIEEGLASGADDYITKPFALKELKARIGAGARFVRLQDRMIEAQGQLEASEEKYRELVTTSADGVLSVNSDMKVTLWNPAAERIFGYTENEMLGQSLMRIIPARYREAMQKAFSAFGETGSDTAVGMTLQIEGSRKDGTEVSIELSISSKRSSDAYVATAMIRDITDRERAEEEKARLETELRHAQKLESIGTLAAGIAHEINTPTQYVSDNTRFLQDGFADVVELLRKYGQLLAAAKEGNLTPELVAEVESAAERADVEYLVEEIPQAIQHSLEGIDRVSKIVRAMKGFSHPSEGERTAVDINKAIENTITIARNEWKYVADMVTQFDDDLPPVSCLLGDFNQVILNLILNAAHAIADVVGDGSSGKGQITVSTQQNDGWAEIRVADTGAGIPEEIRNRIFDPFFTTKEVGKGMGQGLAIGRSVITEKHNGTIDFETEMGRGTTFVVRLPIVDRTTDETPKG